MAPSTSHICISHRVIDFKPVTKWLKTCHNNASYLGAQILCWILLKTCLSTESALCTFSKFVWEPHPREGKKFSQIQRKNGQSFLSLSSLENSTMAVSLLSRFSHKSCISNVCEAQAEVTFVPSLNVLCCGAVPESAEGDAASAFDDVLGLWKLGKLHRWRFLSWSVMRPAMLLTWGSCLGSPITLGSDWCTSELERYGVISGGKKCWFRRATFASARILWSFSSGTLAERSVGRSALSSTSGSTSLASEMMTSGTGLFVSDDVSLSPNCASFLEVSVMGPSSRLPWSLLLLVTPSYFFLKLEVECLPLVCISCSRLMCPFSSAGKNTEFSLVCRL